MSSELKRPPIQPRMTRISGGQNCWKHGNPFAGFPPLDDRLPCPECYGKNSIELPDRADLRDVLLSKKWDPTCGDWKVALKTKIWRITLVCLTDEFGSEYEPFAWTTSE